MSDEKWRERHRDNVARWRAKRAEEVKAIVDARKASPCAGCGREFEPAMMTLVPKEPKPWAQEPIETIRDAVERSTVLCASCARK